MSRTETRVRRPSAKKEREQEFGYRNNFHPENYNGGERRPSRKKFSWVRRLMQGQARNQNDDETSGEQNDPERRNGGVKFVQSPRAGAERKERDSYLHDTEENANGQADESDMESSGYTSSGNESNVYAALSPHVDGSDNVSTTPLKSVTSASTKTTSLLSNNPELHSNAASVETSIPSAINGILQSAPGHALQQSLNERDSDSVITLASSSRRARRRSCETSSSTAAIPPSSIMERLAVHPNASASYANSVQNSFNERN